MGDPDKRNKDGKWRVRIYFGTNAEHEFPARDQRNARDIAARCTREGVWIVDPKDKTEEFFPTHVVHKAKILPPDYKGR